MLGHTVKVTSAVTRPRRPPTPDFDALYEEHVAYVWRLLQRLGVPESGIDDAVQEVFLVALRQLAGFRGHSSLKTWLGGICVGVATNLRRSFARKGSLELPLEEHAFELESEGSLEESVGHRQSIAHLLRLLAQLDEEQRTVFVLAELEELTAPEISEATGININTIYTRLRAARQRFNALLAKENLR